MVVLLVMGLLGTLILVVGGLMVFSRFAGGQQASAVVPCWLRYEPGERWVKGSVRYEGDHLVFRGAGAQGRRRHHWERSALELGMAQEAPSELALGFPPDGLTTVSCHYGRQRFELTLGTQQYTALRSWLESVPPGWNANIA